MSGKPRWLLGAATLALTLGAAGADAATGGGAMPYSSYLQTLRVSVTGELPLIISLIGIVFGVGGWIVGGELGGMMMVLVRVICGAAIILGATTLITNLATTGAVIDSTPVIEWSESLPSGDRW